MGITIELSAISRGYDRKTCWVHSRPGIIPGPGGCAVVTMQKLRLTGNDVFYALSDMRSDDDGRTWTGPNEHADTLGRRSIGDGVEEGICDFWPTYHAKTGVLLGTGHTVRYHHDNLPRQDTPRTTAYSIYDRSSRCWSPWEKIQMPVDPPPFTTGGAGSTQRVDLPDGDILLPIYYTLPCDGTAPDGMSLAQCVSTVMRCAFDGKSLRYLHHGDELTVAGGRGLCEPSLIGFGGRYYLTLRNDDRGYVTAGDDGLHFAPPREWTFDDGSPLGNYNTQQHWLAMPDALYLIYTRRGANNDHVFRHRAPLFIARVDPERLRVMRKTEKVLVPERGARLCNFGVARVSETESWVMVAEWMQTTGPDPSDFAVCERYGSDNSVFLARVRHSTAER